MTGADKERFDEADVLAWIWHRMEESEKFAAEQRKLIAESQKFGAEQQKLYAEARKLDRDRWLAPLIVAGGVGGGVATVVSLLLNLAK